MNHSNQIVEFFEENFNEKKCHEICRKHKFIKRSSSKLIGHEFIKTMIMPSIGSSTDSLKGLCKRILDFNPDANLTSQALCQRINQSSSSQLMQGIFGELLFKVNDRISQCCLKTTSALVNFNRVLLQDSTIVTLNEKLKDVYEGTSRGNNCVKSQVKIDVIHDLLKGVIVDAKLFKGNDPDQGLAGRILTLIQANDLVIRDLGYFTILTFKAIQIADAYFLSRLLPRIRFYLFQEDTKALDLGKYLAHKSLSKLNIIEIKGFLGEEKVPIRLIIYRQSQEVTNKRLREAKKKTRKRGEVMSASKRLLLNFSMFVTNAPEEYLSTAMVGTVYRLRWEIELVFKRWKSQLNIDHLEGIHVERIDCLIWSRLCTALIIEFISGIFNNFIEKLFVVELSSVKFIQYLMRGDKFRQALATNKLELFFDQMEKDIPKMLLKDKRKRRTMRERVFMKESYYEIQPICNQHVA